MTSNTSQIPSYAKFGAAAGGGVAATLVCYPLELLKTRMQVYGAGSSKERISTSEIIKEIYRTSGIGGFYSGLTASVLRQATYTGTRVGLFQIMLDYFTVDGKPPSVYVKACCGIISGICGGIAGLPPDVVMIRMMADGNVAPEKRRNYTSLFNAFSRIVKEEGAATLFRGFTPVCVRAAMMNISQLISYMKAKEFILNNDLMNDNLSCHTASSLFSALIATTFVLPADIAKTRIQNMKYVDGKPEYSNIIDAWVKIVTREGPTALWKGFTPMFCRNAPQFIFFFVVYEQLILLYKRFANIK